MPMADLFDEMLDGFISLERFPSQVTLQTCKMANGFVVFN
jgi:hypothetical protein